MCNLLDVIRKIKPCDINKPYIFISYSQYDRELVWNDVLEFQCRGYNIWLDEKNLDKTNASWKEDALAAIEDMDCLLLVFYVSSHSLSSDACYQELRKTVAESTKALHFGPVKFIAVDAETIGDITTFHQKVFAKIKTSDLEKEERKKQALALNGFMNQFFNSNNEKVRVHPKNEKNRKVDYYEEILASFPDETKIYSERPITVKTEIKEKDFAKTEESIEYTQKEITKSDLTEYSPQEISTDDSIEFIDSTENVLQYEYQGIKTEESNNTEIAGQTESVNSKKTLSYFTYDDELPVDSIFKERRFRKKNIKEANQGQGLYRLDDGYTAIDCTIMGGGIFSGRYDVKIMELPDSIERLNIGEFCNCRNLQRIRMPRYLKIIKQETFKNCISLKNMIIPGNVTQIASRAFQGCSALEELKLSARLEELGICAFENCTSLKELYLPPMLEKMGISCFKNCSMLQGVIIPGTLKKIEHGAFRKCASLEVVYLMDGVKEIEAAFSDCKEGMHIWIPDSVCEISSIAFHNTNPVIHCSKYSYAYSYAITNHIACIIDDLTFPSTKLV